MDRAIKRHISGDDAPREGVSPLSQRVAQGYQARNEGTQILSSCQVHATYRTRPSQGGSRRTGANNTDSGDRIGYRQMQIGANALREVNGWGQQCIVGGTQNLCTGKEGGKPQEG